MDIEAQGKVQEATLEAVIIRADGTRIDLGEVSHYHKNPLKRLTWKLTQGRAAKKAIRAANKEVAS